MRSTLRSLSLPSPSAIRSAVVLAVAVVAVAGITGCEQQSSVEDAVDDTVDSVEDAADDVADGIDDAAEAVGEGIDDITGG